MCIYIYIYINLYKQTVVSLYLLFSAQRGSTPFIFLTFYHTNFFRHIALYNKHLFFIKSPPNKKRGKYGYHKELFPIARSIAVYKEKNIVHLRQKITPINLIVFSAL